MEKAIIAQSSPSGRGAISIIRMSGENVHGIFGGCFSSKSPDKPNYMRLGTLTAGSICDKVMAVCYAAPHSYTGEDMVEIFCHGSPAIVQTIIMHFVSLGVSLASGGELTKRAFLNGKLSLDGAEAVADLINAESSKQINVAFAGVMGKTSNKISEIITKLGECLAYIEVAIDYPEEELEEQSADEACEKLRVVRADLNTLASTFSNGSIIRSGVRVAITGKPNVGKSSLLNALLGYDRAIVGDIAGTTRDTIYESFTYNGLLFNLIDTAGLRQASDSAEIEGVSRAIAEAENAHIVVWLGDDENGFCDKPACKRVVRVLNKVDASKLTDADVYISTKSGEGLETLKQMLCSQCEGVATGGEVITNQRHYDAIVRGIEYLDLAVNAPYVTSDCLAVPIKSAMTMLGEIVGVSATEQVIDAIFATFCVGK